MAPYETSFVGAMAKNSIEVVKVYLQQSRLGTFIDCRIWTLPRANEPGSEAPTASGISLNVELLPELLRILERAERLGHKAGLGAEN